MPTPSSNAPNPNPPSPRPFPFPSCPEAEEQQQQHQQQQQAFQPTSSPDAPSIWPPRAPPALSDEPRPVANPHASNDSPSSRSATTMSPGPQAEGARDVDMEQEPEQRVTGAARDDAGEGHKRSDAEDETLTTAEDPAAAVGSRAGAVARRASGEGSGTGKQQPDGPSPVVGEIHEADVWGPPPRGPRWVEDSGLVGLGLEYSHMRVIPTPPSLYLRPGSRFVGSQQSERQRYDVEVEIKHVDMRESFLCGYLRIQGLTDDHPTLTTYFEGEIIGTKYGFITQNPAWGATEKIDLSHWSKFTAFRPFAKQARRGGQILIKDVAQRENIFMRWKEHFLVPDHRVRTINGASFEGFYYICFNQVRGEVSGIYFHNRSENLQQLELKYVDNKGSFGALEFR